MCGIFGVISTGKVDPRVCKFFSDAFLAGAVRGVDSVGAFQVDKKRDVYIEKKAVAAADFIELKHTKAIISDVDTCVLTVGHNRAATNGKVIDRNAHPFEVPLEEHTKPLVGVHNGSLTSWTRRDRELADIEEEFEVDSHWALAKISKSLDLKATLEDFKGPFVFNWYDPRVKDTCYIARGTGRPVHFCTVKDGNDTRYVVWASEAGMLSWLLERNSLTVADGKIFEVPENTLVEFSLTKVGEYKTTSFTPKLTSWTSNGNYSSSNWSNSNSTYASENYSKNFVSELKRIIEEAKESIAPKRSNVLTLPSSGKPRVPGHSNVELAKNLNLHGETVVFQAVTYDEKTRTIHGEALANDAQVAYPAAIHGADAALGEALCLASWCECDVVAAASVEGGSVKLILKRPTAVYPGSNPADQEKIDRLLNSRKQADPATVH